MIVFVAYILLPKQSGLPPLQEPLGLEPFPPQVLVVSPFRKNPSAHAKLATVLNLNGSAVSGA